MGSAKSHSRPTRPVGGREKCTDPPTGSDTPSMVAARDLFSLTWLMSNYLLFQIYRMDYFACIPEGFYLTNGISGISGINGINGYRYGPCIDKPAAKLSHGG